MTLNLKQLNCGLVSEFKESPITGYNSLFVLLLALFSLVLSVKYFLEIAKMYKSLRETYIEKEKKMLNRANTREITFSRI